MSNLLLSIGRFERGEKCSEDATRWGALAQPPGYLIRVESESAPPPEWFAARGWDVLSIGAPSASRTHRDRWLLSCEAPSRSPEAWSAVGDFLRHWGNVPVAVVIGANSAHEITIATYSRFVTPGSFLVVEHTILDHVKARTEPGWRGPYAALREWLPAHPEFVVDREIEGLYPVTFSPYGWLRRTR